MVICFGGCLLLFDICRLLWHILLVILDLLRLGEVVLHGMRRFVLVTLVAYRFFPIVAIGTGVRLASAGFWAGRKA